MFKKIVANFHTLQDHHQILVALAIAFSAICVTWGAEKLLEKYLFPNRPEIGYFIAVIMGLAVLWLVKHALLHQI